MDHIALRRVHGAWRRSLLGWQFCTASNSLGPTPYRDVAEACTLLNSIRGSTLDYPSTCPQTSIHFYLLRNGASKHDPRVLGTTTTVKKADATSSYASSLVAQAYLHNEDQSIEKTSHKSLERIIVFSVGGGFALLALFACIVIVARHIVATYHARQLLLAFRDSEATRNMIAIYKPVLQHLRVPPFPLPAPHNDVEKEFHHAASLCYSFDRSFHKHCSVISTRIINETRMVHGTLQHRTFDWR